MHDQPFRPSGSLRSADTPAGAGQLSNQCDNARAVSSAVPGDRRSAVWSSIARVDESVSPDGVFESHRGSVPGGWQRAPGTGSADGRDVGPFGGRSADGTPRFDQAVKDGGYCWWYLDALSDCGSFGITLIAFVGSVFSPWYRFASRHKAAAAQNHCCLNVALYGKPGSFINRRWAMTERSAQSVHRTTNEFTIGPSRMVWDGKAITFDICEVGVPIPQKVIGTVKVHPHGFSRHLWALDAAAAHHWGPIAPSATVEVTMREPSIRWSGHGYFDANEGTQPVNQIDTPVFVDWDWSRASMSDGSTAVIYDVRQAAGLPERVLALKFSKDASTVESFEPPAKQTLAPTLWRIKRQMRSDIAVVPRVLQTLEDTPFYARSILQSGLLGESVTSLHETLDIGRLTSMSTQLMLPWRMPRVR